jgi:hypothetical protein
LSFEAMGGMKVPRDNSPFTGETIRTGTPVRTRGASRKPEGFS